MRGSGGAKRLFLENADFRRLWAGDVVSLFGDWFSSIAVITLVWELTGSPTAIGFVSALRMGGAALASPLAGVLADRIDRRRLLIGADLLRACVVPLFMVAARLDSVALVYGLLIAQVSIAAVFRPARSALIPRLVARDDLLIANAIMSASWSTMLAVGAAIGGIATSALGTDAVFTIDAATFVLSAALIARTRRDAGTVPVGETARVGRAYRDIIAGLAYLKRTPDVGRVALAKAVSGLGGGALVFLLALVGDELSGGDMARGLGWLLAARGVGTGVGPFIARRLLPDMSTWMRSLGVFVMISGAAYLALGLVPWTVGIAALVAIAHMASGANWVLSTVLLQHRADDAFRGRAFAGEWFALMGIEALTVMLASWIVESGLLDLRGAVVAFAGLQLGCGAVWWLMNRTPSDNARISS